MKTKRFIAAFALITFFAACKKNDNPVETPKITAGVYALSEGLYNSNNATLTYYNFSTGTATTDYYANKNGSGLGDSGNDLLLYGGKLYVVMNGSSYVEVADAKTALSIAKIPFKTASNVPRQPRYAVAYKNKVLVSSYDGTVAVIDTTSLSIEKFIAVGSNPEQMAVSGTNLFVANSGGLNPVMDSTISVVDLLSFTETKKITVGLNPGAITADDGGNIYVGCTGNYGSIKPRLVKINTATYNIVKSADTAVGKIRFFGGVLYATGGYLGSPNLRKLSTTDFAQASSNFVADGTSITLPYGLNIDPANGDVYVTDAKNYITSGEVFCFDKSGKKKFSFSVSPGFNPNTVALIKQ